MEISSESHNHHAKWKKHDEKEYIVYASIYMKF